MLCCAVLCHNSAAAPPAVAVISLALALSILGAALMENVTINIYL